MCGISPQASLYASTDSTLISPTNGAYWAAVDAAQSQKRYLKPSTWWGGAPRGAGGQSPNCAPRTKQENCNRNKCRLQSRKRTTTGKEPPKEPKNHQKTKIPHPCAASTTAHQCAPPLVWLLHRLTRRAPYVYRSRRRDYAAQKKRGAQKHRKNNKKRALRQNPIKTRHLFDNDNILWYNKCATKKIPKGVITQMIPQSKPKSQCAPQQEQPQPLTRWTKLHRETLWAAAQLMRAAVNAPALAGRAHRMSNCSTFIEYEIALETGVIRLKRANLCRDRLCPTCNWRLAIRRAAEMQETIKAIATANPTAVGLLLTLTVKNCPSDKLRWTIQHLSQSFTRLRKHRLFARKVMGYARSIEVTYNPATDTYHPHIHALLIVPREYLNAPITQTEYARMWQKAAALDYLPIVDIRRTYAPPADDTSTDDAPAPEMQVITARISELEEGTKEAVKYFVKPAALRAILASEDLDELAIALSGHRLIAYGGCIKNTRAALGYTDTPTDTPADDTETDIIPAPSTPLETLAFTWCMATSSYVRIDNDGLPVATDEQDREDGGRTI